jgi:hypothetical protein
MTHAAERTTPSISATEDVFRTGAGIRTPTAVFEGLVFHTSSPSLPHPSAKEQFETYSPNDFRPRRYPADFIDAADSAMAVNTPCGRTALIPPEPRTSTIFPAGRSCATSAYLVGITRRSACVLAWIRSRNAVSARRGFNRSTPRMNSSARTFSPARPVVSSHATGGLARAQRGPAAASSLPDEAAGSGAR